MNEMLMQAVCTATVVVVGSLMLKTSEHAIGPANAMIVIRIAIRVSQVI